MDISSYIRGISLLSIIMLCYSTILIGNYYIYNDIAVNILMLWLIFYSGLIIFYITLFFMKKIKMTFTYIRYMAFVSLFISSIYIAISIINFNIFKYTMEYYYLLHITYILGLCMLIACSCILSCDSEVSEVPTYK